MLDTSAWVEFLTATQAFPRGLLVKRQLVVSVLAVAELVTLAHQGRIPSDLPNRVLVSGRLEPCEIDDAIAGGQLHATLRGQGNRKVSTIDCIMYASARRIGCDLLTCDEDLMGQPGVQRP